MNDVHQATREIFKPLCIRVLLSIMFFTVLPTDIDYFVESYIVSLLLW